MNGRTGNLGLRTFRRSVVCLVVSLLTANTHGIWAAGNYAGGEFHDADQSGYALVGHQNYGIWAGGSGVGGMGGEFHDHEHGNWARVAESALKIWGNGSLNFVQNHPERSDRIIVYAAPEGDEVATYTRGTGRLSDGQARVRLGETFEWVTNPDIGLTAYVTPRGEPIPVSVSSVSTEELVVRGPAGSNAVFDFIVYGLRIGFEEVSNVEEKTIESFIPSMQVYRDRYEQHPELRRFNALERFKDMVAAVEGVDTVDLSRATALQAAIQEYDPQIHGPASALLGHSPPPRESAVENRTAMNGDEPVLEEHGPGPAGDWQIESRSPAVEVTAAGVGSAERESDLPAPASWNGAWMPTSRTVEPGDILALDIEHVGQLHRAEQMADATVVGVAMAAENALESNDGTTTSQALVALTGLVECKVDAGYGAIRAGDLLTSSPTPGHAMRALEPLPGTVLGKALDSLDAGTGVIRVVLMPR